MIKNILSAIVICALLIVAGCKQDTDNTKLAPYLYDYVPLNVGHSVIYDVDSTSYNYITGDSQIVNTYHYQEQRLIHDTFYDAMGNVNYTIYIYKRPDSTQSFVLDREWYCFDQKSTYETVEDDLHFVKFVFPPIVGVNWQGNEYLPINDTVQDTYYPYAGWTYTFTAVNSPSTVNTTRFDSTATVTEINTQNLVQDEISIETYARHVGLIYRQWEMINKQDVTSSWTNPNQANGFRMFMRVHSYTP